MTRDAFDMFEQPERGLFGDKEQRSRGARVTGASDLVDLDLILHNDNTSKLAIAVSFSVDTPFEQWKWLPRSLIEYEKTGARSVRVTMPERLAVEKGLA